ncbi:MAG TPA: 5'-methylthioadenosine/adenosylhomocysteine nucleosidase [Lutibacter sp.]|nr:5'-methylthioadenosine/adenosylhomocysteine nucleosidase [Lutibacter sp.]
MIGLVSAMPEEMQSLLNELQISKTLEKGKRTYYQGTIFNQDVVLVFSRWGKVAAAATVTQLINSFAISEIIFSGVAGAIDSKLNIGDIVLGTELIQHDIDASPLYPSLEIPLLGITSFKTKNTTNLEIATQQFLKNYNYYFNKKTLENFDINKTPKLEKGTIVSGDQFVNSSEKIKEIQKLVPQSLCVEMEGAAVAQVCYEYEIPFQIIRIISDKADDNSHIDFPKFANEVAGKYTLGILEKYLS